MEVELNHVTGSSGAAATHSKLLIVLDATWTEWFMELQQVAIGLDGARIYISVGKKSSDLAGVI